MCDKCGQLGLGFDGSPIVYYNAGRLVRGNFTPCNPHILKRAGATHICQCGSEAIAQRILFDDYKTISKSAKGSRRLFKTAVGKYEKLALENKLHAEIRELKVAVSPANVSIKRDEITARCRRAVGAVKHCLENGRRVKLVKGKIYAQVFPDNEQFYRLDV